MSRRLSVVRHHATHQELTGRAKPGRVARLNLDAIIVPGSRPATNLDHAVTLARAAGCWLLIICSQRLRGPEVKEFLAERSFRKAIVIDLPPGYQHELLDFPELRSIGADLPPECSYFSTDLSVKRNIALVLAKMLGWERIFFLDDDIRDIAYPNLQATVDMLGSFPAVGMRVTHFPDNSIVCHANRETAGSQDVFVSGAALAVRCNQDIGFFPDIYNEDWFFFFDDVSNGRLANSGLEATQLTYYPFANEKRAAWQEFGDVLAEGLYSLLHLGWKVWEATPEYWISFLRARRIFLEAILARSQKADPEMHGEIVASVQSALDCLKRIDPDFCARYIQAWRADLVLWKRRMAELSAASPIPLQEALARLGLSSTAPADKHWRVRPNWNESRPDVTAGPVPIPQIDTMRELAVHVSSWPPIAATVRQETSALNAVTGGAAGTVGRMRDSGSPRPAHEAPGRHRKHRDKPKIKILSHWAGVWSSRRLAVQVGAPDSAAVAASTSDLVEPAARARELVRQF